NRYADVAGLADAARRNRSGRDSAAGGAARAQRGDRHRQGRHPRRKPDVAEIRSAGRVGSRDLGWAVPRPTAEMVRHALYRERYGYRPRDRPSGIRCLEVDTARAIAGTDRSVQAPALYRNSGRAPGVLRRRESVLNATSEA